MLASISPLGERARNSRWRTTVGFYLAGSVLGGAAFGAAAGGLGSVALASLSPTVREAALVAALVVAAVLDAGAVRRIPSVRRQVSEDWLRRYRGWVYGLAFGVQLGLGVVTVVTTSAVYVLAAAEAMSASVRTGAAIGAAFGLVRAAPVLAAGRLRTPGQLLGLDATLRRWERPARRLTALALGVLAVAGLVLAAT